jgi:hypothetical protein
MRYLEIAGQMWNQKPLWFRYFCFFMAGVVTGVAGG